MKCSKCHEGFADKDLQLSHDVPKYIGGLDSDGRHYLCKKCHDIYERTLMSFMTRLLSEETKERMRDRAKIFCRNFFKKEDGESGFLH